MIASVSSSPALSCTFVRSRWNASATSWWLSLSNRSRVALGKGLRAGISPSTSSPNRRSSSSLSRIRRRSPFAIREAKSAAIAPSPIDPTRSGIFRGVYGPLGSRAASSSSSVNRSERRRRVASAAAAFATVAAPIAVGLSALMRKMPVPDATLASIVAFETPGTLGAAASAASRKLSVFVSSISDGSRKRTASTEAKSIVAPRGWTSRVAVDRYVSLGR